MSKVKTLQEALELKARKRAKKEIHDAFLEIRKITQLKCARNVKVIYNGKEETLADSLWWYDKPIIIDAINELTEKYIPEEVANFLNSVERTKQEIESLEQYYQNYQQQ